MAQAHQKLAGSILRYFCFGWQHNPDLDQSFEIDHRLRFRLDLFRNGDHGGRPSSKETIYQRTEASRSPAIVSNCWPCYREEVAVKGTEWRLQSNGSVKYLPSPPPFFPSVKLARERFPRRRVARHGDSSGQRRESFENRFPFCFG